MKKIKNRSLLLAPVVALSMGAALAYGALPQFNSASSVSLAPAGTPAPAKDQALPAKDPQVSAFQLASIPYGPVPQQFDALPLGQAQVSPPQAEAALTPVLAGPIEEDCRIDLYGHKAPLPVDLLVEIMRKGQIALGPAAGADQIRMLWQADLNRSGETQEAKKIALIKLTAAYRPNTAGSTALQKPFDLIDSGNVYANGYDPCDNPTAISGGSAFGQGPFENDFATINPVPVVVANMGSTTEGAAP